MEITSPEFLDGGMLPAKYTCDGPGISPPLAWNGIPKATKSIALICDDPDAPSGTWTHWVLFNLPPITKGLAENIHTFPQGTKIGINSSAHNNYHPPCPPSGSHHYFFKLFALDTVLNLKDQVTSEDLQSAMQGHILDQAVIMGKYQRRK